MKTLENALKLYFEHFGQNYPLCITGGQSEDEIIADIENCIKTNELAKEPEYEDDADY